jgi:hypothetical protein
MSDKFIVGKKFQTNQLSQTPGGVSVVVKLKDGTERIYENIKNPDAYIKKIKAKSDILDAYVYIEENKNTPEDDDLPF